MQLNKKKLLASEVSHMEGKIGRHIFLPKNGIKENKNIKTFINITIRIIVSEFNHIRTIKSSM